MSFLLFNPAFTDNLTTEETPSENEEKSIEEPSFTAWILSEFHTLLELVYDETSSGNFSQAASIFSSGFDRVNKFIELTDFQAKLLREFSLILLGNSLLVLLAWKIYGPRISAKFGFQRGGSRRAIEELRLSMSEFQLPKEHDFKFK